MTTPTRRGRLEVIEQPRTRRSRWFWRRRGANGRLAGTSLPDTYSRWTDARRAAKREYPELAGALIRLITRHGVSSR